MTRAIILCLMLTAAPAAAQEEGRDWREGLGFLQEGAERMLRGLLDEMDPVLRDLRDRIDDLSVYHPPEVLPNGDIIIRRRTPLEPEHSFPPGEEVEI